MATQTEIYEVISTLTEEEFQRVSDKLFWGKRLTKREVIILYYN